MKKSIWNEKPLSELDLFEIVREEQEKCPDKTKMDIFRGLSKKYNKILTPDQFNFRYNYLIRRKKIREAKAKIAQVCSMNLPFCAPIDLKLIDNPPIKITHHSFRDDNQQLLDMGKALYDMIDPYKLVKFCDKQLKLQKKRRSSGGLKVIFESLSKICNQKVITISARYYNTRKKGLVDNSKVSSLEKQITEGMTTLIMLENKINNLEKENDRLSEKYTVTCKDFTKLYDDYSLINTENRQLKQRPLVKLSFLIESLMNYIKSKIKK